MKKMILITMLTSFFVMGCVGDFTSGELVRFEELKADKWYNEFDDNGNVIMIADSIFKNINGVPTKVGVNPRPVKRMGKDSIAYVRPSKAVVKKALKIDPWHEAKVIWGIILLIAMIPVYFFVLTRQSGMRWTSFPAAGVAGLLMYFGMQGVQKRQFEASELNEKKLTMDEYRLWFGNDPKGTDYWDKQIRENRIEGLSNPEQK